MKKRFKCIIFIMMLLMILLVIPNNVNATYDFSSEVGKEWINKDYTDTSGGIIEATQNVMGIIIQIIRIVGTGIAIIMLTYIAIKYMLAAPNEKADFKKSATAYIVGAIILFASSNILGIIYDFANAATAIS